MDEKFDYVSEYIWDQSDDTDNKTIKSLQDIYKVLENYFEGFEGEDVAIDFERYYDSTKNNFKYVLTFSNRKNNQINSVIKEN